VIVIKNRKQVKVFHIIIDKKKLGKVLTEGLRVQKESNMGAVMRMLDFAFDIVAIEKDIEFRRTGQLYVYPRVEQLRIGTER